MGNMWGKRDEPSTGTSIEDADATTPLNSAGQRTEEQGAQGAPHGMQGAWGAPQEDARTDAPIMVLATATPPPGAQKGQAKGGDTHDGTGQGLQPVSINTLFAEVLSLSV